MNTINLDNILAISKRNSIEAQRLASDCANLVTLPESNSQTETKGFLSRVISKFKFTPNNNISITPSELSNLKNAARQYIQLLSDNDALAIEAIISVKNQIDYKLNYLAEKQDKTLDQLQNIIQKISSKFENLQHRIEKLEETTALHSWIITIEEYGYDTLPEQIRMLRIIHDFRSLKQDELSNSDIRCFRSALRRVQINPDDKTTIKNFVEGLVSSNYPNKYTEKIENYTLLEIIDPKKVIENISQPITSAILLFAENYARYAQAVKVVADNYNNIPEEEAISKIILDNISANGIDINTEIENSHLALEIFTGLKLSLYYGNKKGLACTNKYCSSNAISYFPGYCSSCGQYLQPIL